MIIDRYIWKSLLKPFVSGIAASVVMVVANILMYYLKMVNEANIPPDIVLRFFIYHLPSIAVISFPMGFLFAVLITLGRFSRDHEITAMNACGISFTRIITPVILMSIFVSGLSFFINEEVVPYSNSQRNILYADILNNPRVMPVKEKLFLDTKQGRYFYVEKIDKEKALYKNVTIFDNTKNFNQTDINKKIEYPRLISAESAERKNGKWLLYKGNLKNFDKDGHISYESDFKEMELEFKIDKNSFAYSPESIDSNNRSQSKQIIKKLKAQGIDTKSKEVEYQSKFSLPLATFFVTLVSAPIGIRFAKKGTYFGVAICIALIFIWNLINTYALALGNKGTIDPFVSAWIQNIIFAVCGIFMISRTNK